MSRFVTNITKSKKNQKDLQDVDVSVAILCAGVGNRIKSYEPRSTIKIGNKMLLEHQIDVVDSCFKHPEIICVSGYSSQKIIKRFSDHVRIVENQLYETTNPSESIRLAFNNTCKNKFLFMHGDLWFNRDTLKNVSYDKSFVIIDTKKRFNTKEVGLTVGGNSKATFFSYGLETKWCQIAFFTGKEFKIAKNLFNKFETHDKKMLSFEILNKMISLGASFECYEPRNMKIVEIDRIKDIAYEDTNIK